MAGYQRCLSNIIKLLLRTNHHISIFVQIKLQLIFKTNIDKYQL